MLFSSEFTAAKLSSAKSCYWYIQQAINPVKSIHGLNWSSDASYMAVNNSAVVFSPLFLSPQPSIVLCCPVLFYCGKSYKQRPGLCQYMAHIHLYHRNKHGCVFKSIIKAKAFAALFCYFGFDCLFLIAEFKICVLILPLVIPILFAIVE